MRNVSVLFDKRRAFSAALWSRFLKRPITYSVYSALRVKATTRRRKRAHFEKSRKIYYLSGVCASETRRGTSSKHFPVWQQIVLCESILNFKKLSVRRTYTWAATQTRGEASVSCSRDLHEPRNAAKSTPYGLPSWSALVIFLSCSVAARPFEGRVVSLYRSRSIRRDWFVKAMLIEHSPFVKNSMQLKAKVHSLKCVCRMRESMLWGHKRSNDYVRI